MNFMRGDCFVLALALADATKWPVHALETKDGVEHAFVKKGDYVMDARGLLNVRDLSKGGPQGGTVRRATAAELAEWDYRYDEVEHGKAAAEARRIVSASGAKMNPEPETCARCDEDQPLGEDGKCDNCDGYPCEGCGRRGDALNENMMCPDCEPPEEECLECGEMAVLVPDGDPNVGLCPNCVERAQAGDGCAECGDGGVDLTDGVCDACAEENLKGKSDDTPRWLRNVVKDRKKVVEKAVRSALGKDAKVDWKKRFGCGHYGCAYAVKERGHKEPRYVVKVTRDPTEGPMQATIARRQKAGDYGFDDGFAIVRGVYRIGDDVQHMGKMWPVYAIVREEVTPVTAVMYEPGSIYPPVTPGQLASVMTALNNYKDNAAKWYALKERKASERALGSVEKLMDASLRAISNYAPPLGEIMGIMQHEGTPLRDVHSQNIGVRHHPGIVDPDDPDASLGYITIFDPGHTPYEGEAGTSIPRMNPGADANPPDQTLKYSVTLKTPTLIVEADDPRGAHPAGRGSVGALSVIKYLWRQSDTMALYGIPHELREGQSPNDLFRAEWPGRMQPGQRARDVHPRKPAREVPSDWVWLGTPGWYGNMTRDQVDAVKAYVRGLADVPSGPGEWCAVEVKS